MEVGTTEASRSGETLREILSLPKPPAFGNPYIPPCPDSRAGGKHAQAASSSMVATPAVALLGPSSER